MSGWTLYHNPRCSKSRTVLKALQDRGITPQIIEYLKYPPTYETIITLIENAKGDAKQFIRIKDPAFSAYTHLKLNDANSVAKFLSTNPKLLERPVVTHDSKTLIARPTERLQELFS